MTLYAVNDVYPCIQGEGVQTGIPMVLLRLHGCDVGCPWCDTKETWKFDPHEQVSTLEEALGATAKYAYMSAQPIADFIAAQFLAFRWVLITGGEPARYELHELVAALHGRGYRCALETSGTELGHLNARLDWVCVSPKVNMPGGKAILGAALEAADEIKMVIGRERDIVTLDNLLASCTLKDKTTICLQPLSTNTKATELCIQTVQTRNWRLSLQTHKYLDQR